MHLPCTTVAAGQNFIRNCCRCNRNILDRNCWL